LQGFHSTSSMRQGDPLEAKKTVQPLTSDV
jgi:hypothetical protein